jgi:hypothetical protein
MGFGGGRKPDTSAMEASIRRQEEALRRQEEMLAKREAELKEREEAARRAREGRWRGRALLLTGLETGTEDQPMPGGIKRLLGG